MENVRNEIKKVSLKNERLDVTFSQEFLEDNYSDEVTRKCSQIVHADFKAALDTLKKHLVIICEQPEANDILDAGVDNYDVEKLDNYVVTGYSTGGSDEDAGVTIIGQKLLKSGKVVNINAPFTKYEDFDTYKHGTELSGDIYSCNNEVVEYLFKGKWGIKQQEFDFDVPDEAMTETTSDTEAA